MMISGPSAASAVANGAERALLEHRFALSRDVATAVFDAESDRISRACLAIARRFQRGARLLVFAEGPEVSDATHVAVEFVHPVLVGKRSLPAIALTNDAGALTGLERENPGDGFVRLLQSVGKPVDIALAISRDEGSPRLHRALERARSMEMLTMHLAGGTGEHPTIAELTFVVPTDDAMVVQEVHETIYHVLWELVHVFLDGSQCDV